MVPPQLIILLPKNVSWAGYSRPHTYNCTHANVHADTHAHTPPFLNCSDTFQAFFLSSHRPNTDHSFFLNCRLLIYLMRKGNGLPKLLSHRKHAYSHNVLTYSRCIVSMHLPLKLEHIETSAPIWTWLISPQRPQHSSSATPSSTPLFSCFLLLSINKTWQRPCQVHSSHVVLRERISGGLMDQSVRISRLLYFNLPPRPWHSQLKKDRDGFAWEEVETNSTNFLYAQSWMDFCC